MTDIAKIAAGVGKAAIFGFGASAGRSAWKKTSKHADVLLVLALVLAICLAAVALPFWAGREIVRGHQRTWLAALFLTLVVPLGAIMLGTGAAVLVDFFLQGMQGVQGETVQPRMAVVAAIVGGSTALGLLIGATQRGERLHAFAVADFNEEFLRQRGIREVSEPSASHMDRWGDLLRLIEQSDHQLTFLAVGRRSKRAYIRLGPSGRMLAYSGVVAQDDYWDGSDRLEAEDEANSRARVAATERRSLKIARPPLIDDGIELASEDAFLASLAPPSAQRAGRPAARPLHWAIYWPLALLASAFSGLVALVLWVSFSPDAVRSHPLSVLVILVPVAAAFFLLRRRRKHHWSIYAAQAVQ